MRPPLPRRIAGQRGMDQVRQTEIGVSKIRLKYFEEVFTSEHWMARIVSRPKWCVHQRALDGAHRKSPKVVPNKYPKQGSDGEA